MMEDKGGQPMRGVLWRKVDMKAGRDADVPYLMCVVAGVIKNIKPARQMEDEMAAGSTPIIGSNQETRHIGEVPSFPEDACPITDQLPAQKSKEDTMESYADCKTR